MFNFFGNKKIKAENVKKYKGAIKAIKFYTHLKMYEKSIRACDEILMKEKNSFSNLLNKLEKKKGNDRLIKKESKIFEKRKSEIQKLKLYANSLLKVKEEKVEKEHILEKIKENREKINNIIKLGKPLEAMSDLKSLLKENKDKTEVVHFYNEEKKIIQGAINKEQENIKEKLKNDAKAEAFRLIGRNYEIKQEEKIEKKNIFRRFFNWLFNWDNLKAKIKEEKEIEEINNLIKKDDEKQKELVKSKLENMHKGLLKEAKYDNVVGYEIYGKTLGKGEILTNSFGLSEGKDKYNFFFGESILPGLKGGFIITLLNKYFKKIFKKSLRQIVFDINNSLKQTIKSRNFIKGAFFEIEKETQKLSYVGMGYKSIIFFDNQKKETEEKKLGGIVAGVRIIQNLDSIKPKSLNIKNLDTFIIFSDGIIEAKNDSGEFYGIERLRKNFELVVKSQKSLEKIYEYLIKDINLFKGGIDFEDEITILIVRRDKAKDLINKEDDFIYEISKKEKLNPTEIKFLVGRTKDEIKTEIEKIKRKRETERIVNKLKKIYNNGEILNLKEEAKKYVKEGYFDKRINNLLKKAIANEKKYKIDIENQKMMNKYEILEELYKKGDYDAVIKETENIIAKDGAM